MAVREEENRRSMLVTRETDYAVRCVLYLAQNKEQWTNVSAISDHMLIPKSYLSKILQRLVRAGLVESVRGIKGGFRLNRLSSEITLLDIFSSMQGVTPVNICAVDKRRCELSATCSVHPVWVEIREEVEKRLKRMTIDKLVRKKK